MAAPLPTVPKRPSMVTAVAVIDLLYGVKGFTTGTAALVFGVILRLIAVGIASIPRRGRNPFPTAAMEAVFDNPTTRGWLAAIGVAEATCATVFLVAAWAVFSGKRWARSFALATAAGYLVVVLIRGIGTFSISLATMSAMHAAMEEISRGAPLPPMLPPIPVAIANLSIQLVLGLAWPALSVFFLTRPPVIAYFEGAQR